MVERFLHAKMCSKHFTCMKDLNPLNKSVRSVVLFPFDCNRSWGGEGLGHMPRVTWLEWGRGSALTQALQCMRYSLLLSVAA